MTVKRHLCLLSGGTRCWHHDDVVGHSASHDAGGPRSPIGRRRPAEVRRLLLEAAERVVARKGMSANAQEIAQEAGVHRSVLYRHFTSTQELVQTAALRPFTEFLEKIRQMTDRSNAEGPAPLWDLMTGFLDDLLDILVEHREFLMMAMSEASPFDEDARKELQRKLNSVLDDIAVLAEREGGSRGLEGSTMRVNTRLTIAMALGLVSYGGWMSRDSDGMTVRAALVEQMATLILYGARAVPEAEKQADRTSPRELRLPNGR